MTDLLAPVVTKVSSGKPGVNSVVMVGVHGNEKVGPLILDWLNKLTIIKGTLTIIVANPSALYMNERYVNINLNRRFGLDEDQYP